MHWSVLLVWDKIIWFPPVFINLMLVSNFSFLTYLIKYLTYKIFRRAREFSNIWWWLRDQSNSVASKWNNCAYPTASRGSTNEHMWPADHMLDSPALIKKNFDSLYNNFLFLLCGLFVETIWSFKVTLLHFAKNANIK